ncbi:hypothetical protein FI615_001696 [Enterococcus faecium]|uniref:hypothetical protein n=1 Tax=Enterococcus faecium TaxID=1352 RepID=UPI001924F955|nr:hypothetical protein [Enterococcus faecium]EGP4894209.1 hypothetical protein [Enterococcus faecium]EHK9936765.1 hypothetical protein [Enterococcus faecium]MBL3708357.1 hypothetical protein [Enterococcus faecium]
MNLDVQMVDGLPTVKSTSPALDVQNLITGPKLGSNASQALFTALLESDEGFRMLMNTAMSQQLRALRNGSEGVLLYDTDKDNNRVLVNIPKMSFSPMTSEADSCCVVAGDLQVCQDGTILKSLCLEKCENELDRMIGTVSHTNRNSIVYAAYKEMLKGAGVAKSALPTLEEFELLSLLAQFNLLNMLTFLNGMLEVERNGNIIKRFNGLTQIYAQPDVLAIDGGSGVLAAFNEALCRMNVLGSKYFAGGFFMASRTAYAAIQKAVVKDKAGNYPNGWIVTETTETVNGYSMPVKKYVFNGLPVVLSELLYVDTETMNGDIYLVPPTVGIFSGMPLDADGKFFAKEYNNPKSAFVHFDKQSEQFPTCWTACDRLTNFGAVVSTEVNALLKITNVSPTCDMKSYQGIEGLINPNSYAPYIA